MKDLIAELERATGPDRELDAKIWLAVTPGATRQSAPVNHPKGAYVIDETRDGSGRLIIVSPYTSSLDAAMTLVPEGYSAHLFKQFAAKEIAKPTARLFKHYAVDGDGDIDETEGATLAIAICLVALKAREATK